MTVRAAALALDIHENTVRNWMEHDKLPHVTLPTGFRRPTLAGVMELIAAMASQHPRRQWVVVETIQTQRTWLVEADTAFKASRMVKGLPPDREETAQIEKSATLRSFHA